MFSSPTKPVPLRSAPAPPAENLKRRRNQGEAFVAIPQNLFLDFRPSQRARLEERFPVVYADCLNEDVDKIVDFLKELGLDL